MKTHFPGIKSMETAVNSTSEQQQCNIDLANRIVTPHTVKWAVNTFSPFKSPGLVLCDIMNRAFVIVEEWCGNCGLGVNPDKTELVLFSSRRKIKELTPPTLFSKQLIFKSRLNTLESS